MPDAVQPLAKVVDVRLVVDADLDVGTFLREVGMHPSAVVFGVVELKADGFGHLLPDPATAIVLLDPPQSKEVATALALGEVKA